MVQKIWWFLCAKILFGTVLKIHLKLKLHNITIIFAHAPTEGKEEDEKIKFYEDLEKIPDQSPQFEMEIILGDFNEKIG